MSNYGFFDLMRDSGTKIVDVSGGIISDVKEVAVGAGVIFLVANGGVWWQLDRLVGAEAPAIMGGFYVVVLGVIGTKIYLAIKRHTDDDDDDEGTTPEVQPNLPVNTVNLDDSQEFIQEDIPDAQPQAREIDFDMAHKWLDKLSYAVHLGIANGSGGGKTVMLSHLVNLCRARGEDVVVFDAKGGADLGKWGEGIQVYGSSCDYKVADIHFQGMINEIQDRLDHMRTGVPPNGFPRLVIVIDEAHEFLQHPDCPNGSALLEKMLRLGREYNISIMLSSQDFQAATLNLKGQTKQLDNLQYQVNCNWDKSTMSGEFVVGGRQMTSNVKGKVVKEYKTLPLPLMADPGDLIPIGTDYVSSRFSNNNRLEPVEAAVEGGSSLEHMVNDVFITGYNDNNRLVEPPITTLEPANNHLEPANNHLITTKEPVITTLEGDHLRVANMAIVAFPDDMSVLFKGASVTAGQAMAVRHLAANNFSKNSICAHVFGGKNGVILNLVSEILKDGQVNETDSQTHRGGV